MPTTDARGAVGRSVAFGSKTRIRIELDFGKMLANGSIPITGASGDLLQLFNVYPKDVVEEIFVEVVTPEGDTLTVDIGDYTAAMSAVQADDYHDGLDLNTAAGTLAKAGGGTYGGRKAYIAENIIVMELKNAADTAVVIVEALISRAQN